MRLIAIGCLLLAAFVPAAAQVNNASHDDIIDRGWLEIAVYENFPPFSFRSGSELKGVDVELGELIASGLGVRAVFRERAPDETVDDDLRNTIWKGHYLGGGVADLMMHVPYDREFALRNGQVVITGPYYEERLALARDPAKTGDTPSLMVYRFERIGVELDTLADFYLSGFQGGLLRENVVHYTGIEEAVDGLREGDVAAVFGVRSQLESALGEDRSRFELGFVVAPGLRADRWQLGVAVSANSRQLGYAVDDIMRGLRENGVVEDLFDRHGLTYSPPD